MQSTHSGNEPDYVNGGALSLILGLVAVSTFVIALVVTALVRDEVNAVTAERDETQDASYRQLKSSQLGILEAPAQFKDRAQGVVSLPIGRAMALTLESVRRDPMSLSPWTSQPGSASAETGATTPADPDGAEPASPADDKQAAPDATAASPTAGTVDALTQPPVPAKASAEGNRGSAPATPAPKPAASGATPGTPAPH